MKKSAGKRLAAFGLATALVVSAITVPGEASAAKAVKKVTVNKKKVTLYPGADAGYGSIKIKATVKPKGVKVKWKSNKKKIASVNGKGLIKAKKAGKAVITAKAGKKSAKVKVTVKKIKKKVTNVSVAASSLALSKNQTAVIKASVTPSKATLKKLTYKSSNSKVASVSAKGEVKGLQAGTATITVRAVDGSKKQATVSVQVTDQAAPTTTPGTQASTTPSTQPSVEPSTKPSAEPTTEPTTKPTTEPTTAPTTEPTTAPTTEPTTAPTTEPTTAPTTEPTTAPTTEPTTAPTTEPTTAPTTEPTTAPTTEPTTAPTPEVITPEVDTENEGNLKYTLDNDSDYVVDTTILGQDISLNTTDNTMYQADQAIGKLLKGMTEFFINEESYANKVIDEKTVEIADGVTVTVSKPEGNVDDKFNGKMSIKVAGVSKDLDGEYLAKIFPDGDGKYDMTDVNGKYWFQACDKDWKKQVVVRFAESTPVTDADGNQTITYEIDELSLQLNNDKEVWSAGSDASDNIKVTVTSNATTGESLIVAERNGNKIVIKKDASGYTISAPEAYLKKYGLQVAEKK